MHQEQIHVLINKSLSHGEIRKCQETLKEQKLEDSNEAHRLWYNVIQLKVMTTHKIVRDDTQWYMIIHNETWWYTMIRDDTWGYMMIHNDTWWYTMIHGDTEMIHGDIKMIQGLMITEMTHG